MMRKTGGSAIFRDGVLVEFVPDSGAHVDRTVESRITSLMYGDYEASLVPEADFVQRRHRYVVVPSTEYVEVEDE